MIDPLQNCKAIGTLQTIVAAKLVLSIANFYISPLQKD